MLTKDEQVHMDRCLTSLAWCEQVLVVDSGSTDRTVALAQEHGADVIETSWRGYGAQRDWAIKLDLIRHDWVYFVDADEWVSNALAAEIAAVIAADGPEAAWEHRLRLVWENTWIRHCGWYDQHWMTLLMRRDRAHYDTTCEFAERAVIRGPVGRLKHDIVDENMKGLHAWLTKHVGYAAVAVSERTMTWSDRRRAICAQGSTMPLGRRLLKFAILPLVPGKPALLWVYMFVLKRGFLHGRIGFRFATLHAVHQYNITLLYVSSRITRHSPLADHAT